MLQENIHTFFKPLYLITLAESLGGVESLVCHPASMTHASIPYEVRQKVGITDGLIRLYIGVESVDDLRADLAQAIQEREKQSNHRLNYIAKGKQIAIVSCTL